MVGIYFSGTGNTKHCVQEFLKNYDRDSTAVSIESPDIHKIITDNDYIILGYPIYYSSLPKIVHDFISTSGDLFKGKKIFIIATMGLFSGDGAGCSARLLKKRGAHIIGGLHLKMPDCIGDEKVLKKSLEKNRFIIKEADAKILLAVENLRTGNPTREGLNIFYHIAGLFGQRLWFYNKTRTYSNNLKIDTNNCIGCGKCIKLCPMNNLKIVNGKAVANGKCTMCYRCFSYCPQKAITILGKQVYEQCRFDKYDQ